MKHDVFHDKIVELTRRNLKNLKTTSEQACKMKRQLSIDLTHHLNSHQRQYEQLLKLSKQSQEQQLRLRRQITTIETQIEQLQMKSNLGRSRIKIQSEEIENIKDQTYDIDRQRRKDDRIERVNTELKESIRKAQEEVQLWQASLKNTQSNISQLQTQYQSLIQKKQAMNRSRKQSHRKNKSRIQELQTQLRQLRSQANSLRILKQKQQEKTKRNHNVQTFNQIFVMLRKYKQSHG